MRYGTKKIVEKYFMQEKFSFWLSIAEKKYVETNTKMESKF
jgi:hypothetical protein